MLVICFKTLDLSTEIYNAEKIQSDRREIDFYTL
jgi:hypothetical protein